MDEAEEQRTDLDNHADTTVVSDETALEIYDYNTPVRVHGYDDGVGRRPNCRMIGAVVAYDDPADGRAWMLVFNQSILIPGMKHNLVCPMQMRDNDIFVNDEPKHMVEDPSEYNHAITVPSVTVDDEPFRIPLSLDGVVSYFPTRKPTWDEYNGTPEERVIHMTASSPEWDPSSNRFSQEEDAMLDRDGRMRDEPKSWTQKRYVAVLNSIPQQGVCDGDLSEALHGTVTFDPGGKTVSKRDPRPTRRPTRIASITSGKRRRAIGPKTLAKNWGIGLGTAQRTVVATTQRSIRTLVDGHMVRRFRTNDRQLRYRRFAHDVFTDTLEANVLSWHRRNRYAQVFATRFGWTRIYPMRNKSDAHEGLSLMAKQDGVPTRIIMDGAREQTMGEFRRKAKEMDVHVRQTEPYSPWQNAAELSIRELKRGSGRKAKKARSPKKLWDHCIELESKVRSNTALPHYELEGQVPETIMSGQPADISHLAELAWYDWVMFWGTKEGYPDYKEVYGRWLGPATDIGPAMCSKILQQNGQVIYTSSYRPLTEEEWESAKERELRDEFDAAIKSKLGDAVTDKDLEEKGASTPVYEVYQDDDDGEHPQQPEVIEPTPEDADNYVGAEVELPQGGKVVQGRVKRRVRDEDNQPMGVANENPILDTRVYEVEFPDGKTADFGANVIAQAMITQCDPLGRQYLLMEAIVDHTKDDTATAKADRYFLHNGKQYPKRNTKGWKLCVRWRNGSTSWEKLSELKESYPVQVAEYAASQGIEDEPAFAWWVPYVFKKRERILSAIKSRYHKRTHKLGFELPKDVEQAIAIDKKNGNTLWQDAIAKEMANVRVAFKILTGGEEIPPGHQFMECHLVFDVKLGEGFRRKARLVAGGHMTEEPAVMTYASVVTRETVRIALTIAALNDLEVKTGDVQNAYLTAPCEEKIYTVLGPEFGEDAGKTALIVRALYGLRSAGASFSRHMADCMRNLGYEPCKAESDLWYKPAVRPDDGFEYYVYVLLYVDDVISIAHDAEKILDDIDTFFQMKPGSIGDPDIYLGAKLRRVQLENGVWAWSASSSKYLQDAIANIEQFIDSNLQGMKLRRNVKHPWPSNYTSEDDETPELDAKMANYYQHLVGVLHWGIELGRVDMITEVSLLASHMAAPRQGHLQAALHVVAYLKAKHNARMVFDPTYPEIDLSLFKTHDWTSFYGDVKEAIPPNAPKPRGKGVDLRLFVDSDHAGDKVRRRSRTGFFIFLNSAPIAWMSKRQPTVETSVFGAEFVAMKHGVETLRGIRYKLRMMGVPIDGPSYVFGDNMSVINNTTKPESVLKKKSNSICYHAIREAVAMGECIVTHITTGENVGDLATKPITNGPKREHLVRKVLYDVYD